MLISPLLNVCSVGWLLNIGCLEPGLSWTSVVLNLSCFEFGCLEPLDVLNFCCVEFGCLEPLLFLHLLNLSMIFRSTELLFFYFEASFFLKCLSSRILELVFFYFEASFLLSYLSSCFNVSWFSRILEFCLLKSSNIAFFFC